VRDSAGGDSASNDSGGDDASSDGGSPDSGDSGSLCGAGAKFCNGGCVSVGNPAYGCTATGCAPCPTYPNETASCVSPNQCAQTCNSGFTHCDNDASDGCETPLGTNSNCTFCGDSCVLPNATAQCQQQGSTSSCNLVQCNVGWGNCDMNPSNGCESILSTINHCGSCANACPYGPNSNAVCNNGVCSIVCALPWADCDMNPSNGCEVDTSTDLANCGACFALCASTCVNGTCF
jgi:hypothetical protein